MVWDKPYSTPDWRLGKPDVAVDRGVVLHASPSIKALGTVPTIVNEYEGAILGWGIPHLMTLFAGSFKVRSHP